MNEVQKYINKGVLKNNKMNRELQKLLNRIDPFEINYAPDLENLYLIDNNGFVIYNNNYYIYNIGKDDMSLADSSINNILYNNGNIICSNTIYTNYTNRFYSNATLIENMTYNGNFIFANKNIIRSQGRGYIPVRAVFQSNIHSLVIFKILHYTSNKLNDTLGISLRSYGLPQPCTS